MVFVPVCRSALQGPGLWSRNAERLQLTSDQDAMIHSYGCGYFSELWRLCCVLCFGTLHDGNAILSETFLPFKEQRRVGWRSLSVGSSRALEEVASKRWQASVSWYVSLCTTVGRYGEYLSSQHLKLDSTDQNNPPAGSPPVLFLASQPNTSVTPGAFLVLCCTSSFLPNNNTFLFFLLTIPHN